MTFTPIPADEPQVALAVGRVEHLVRLLDQIDEFLRDGGGTDLLAGYWTNHRHYSPHGEAGLLCDDVTFHRDWLCQKATSAHQHVELS